MHCPNKNVFSIQCLWIFIYVFIWPDDCFSFLWNLNPFDWSYLEQQFTTPWQLNVYYIFHDGGILCAGLLLLVNVTVMYMSQYILLFGKHILSSSDAGAYFAGEFLEKMLIPWLSPKETIEGSIVRCAAWDLY